MKWYTYIICIACIVAGVFCGIRFYEKIKAKSYVKGSIDITNQFSQESFSYSSTSVVLYHDIYDDTDTYAFNKDLLKVDDFNGVKRNYKVTLNDFVFLNPDIKAGSVYALLEMDFYNTNGDIVCEGQLNISIKFLSNKTTISLATTGQEQASFFEQYFADNGIRLRVVEML